VGVVFAGVWRTHAVERLYERPESKVKIGSGYKKEFFF
jgi:hypothetical protein